MNKTYKYLTGLAVLAALTFAFFHGRPTHPTTDKDIAATTAMITRMDGRSGGTGVVLTSTPFESFILTNRHVCGVVKYGGMVTTDKFQTTVTSYQLSEVHDLCLITVNQNLEVNTEVAEYAPDTYSPVTISGHPMLLKTIITKGNFSGKEVIDIMTGMRNCTKEELETEVGLICAVLGGIPEIKSFNAIVSSALIQPGSSGSPVWDSSGKISALVFAGSGDIGYSHLVPVEYINNFLKNELTHLDHKVPLDDSLAKLNINVEARLKDVCTSETDTLQYEIVKKYCKYINKDLVYYDDNL